MIIELHSISDDRKKIFKTLNPIGSATMNVKSPCNIMRPVVEITKESVGNLWDRCNYAYIQAFGRYYFVDSITVENDGIITLELTIDVLFTYAEQLKRTQFQVVRAQRYYDRFFIDTQIPLKVDKAIRQDPQKDFLGSLPQDTGTNKYNYIMTVAGG